MQRLSKKRRQIQLKKPLESSDSSGFFGAWQEI